MTRGKGSHVYNSLPMTGHNPSEGELLPCPFCGSSEAVEFDGGSVNCLRCDATGPYLSRSKGDAIAAWNTRELLRISPAMEVWQDIETAPKDGRFVLLHCPNGQLESGEVTVGAYWKHDERAENGRFQKGNWDGWLGMDVDIASSWCEPTHWMPLPPSPKGMR